MPLSGRLSRDEAMPRRPPPGDVPRRDSEITESRSNDLARGGVLLRPILDRQKISWSKRLTTKD